MYFAIPDYFYSICLVSELNKSHGRLALCIQQDY